MMSVTTFHPIYYNRIVTKLNTPDRLLPDLPSFDTASVLPPDNTVIVGCPLSLFPYNQLLTKSDQFFSQHLFILLFHYHSSGLIFYREATAIAFKKSLLLFSFL